MLNLHKKLDISYRFKGVREKTQPCLQLLLDGNVPLLPPPSGRKDLQIDAGRSRISLLSCFLWNGRQLLPKVENPAPSGSSRRCHGLVAIRTFLGWEVSWQAAGPHITCALGNLFSFPRKFPGNHHNIISPGWKHWHCKDLAFLFFHSDFLFLNPKVTMIGVFSP